MFAKEMLNQLIVSVLPQLSPYHVLTKDTFVSMGQTLQGIILP